MSQRLIMPFEKQMMLCGYKNAEYKKHWGYAHYGVDISAKEANGDNHVLASGDGVVFAAARDNTLGCGIAVLYKDCESRDGEVKDIVARYMHLSAMKVSKGDIVHAGDILGIEGKEGTEDYHLHLEFDTDTVYPTYSPQVSNNHTFWMKGIDSTVNPSLWLWVGEDQTIVNPTYNPKWLNEEDFNIPNIVEKEEIDMSEMIKLPINEEVPLYVTAIIDGDEDEVEAYGEQVWALVKKPTLPYGFITYDRYMRRTPCYWTDYGGEFVKQEDWDKLVPISEVDPKYLKNRDGFSEPTDRTNYDYLFDIEPEEPDEPVTPDEPVEPDTPVDPKPSNPTVVDGTKTAKILHIIAKAFDEIAEVFE